MIQVRIAFLAAALCAAAAGRADVAFNSFDTGDTYNPNRGITIATATSSAGRQSAAMQFTSATSGFLSSVVVPVWRVSGAGSFQVGFYADDDTDVGTELASWTATATVRNEIFTFSAPAGISLVAGAKYWVGMIAQDDSWLAWSYRPSGATPVNGPYAINYELQDGSVSGEQSAFRVETQPVPEPASMAALGLGAAALLRRRKRA